MSLEHFDRFFTFVAAGLGLFLVGGLNLALGRGGRRFWLRAAATVAVCGAVVAGLSALTRPELAVQSARLLVAVLVVAGILGSAWVGRQVASLAAVVRKPGVRWGLVTLGGLGVVLGSGFAFDQADQAQTEQGMKNLELSVGAPPSHPTDRVKAKTDSGNSVVLREPTSSRTADELTGAEMELLRNSPYHDQVVRRGAAADNSNCHGWVFTGGAFLLAGDEVEAIVKENGYLETYEPQPGDLVVYRQDGKVAHTAVVRYVSEGQPVLVEGKWGTMGVFLHPADKSFYGTEYTFYRSGRTGHLLVGVGGSPGPAADVMATE